jgi:hypothetical protein
MGQKKLYRIWVRTYFGKWSLGRPRKWEDNIKMQLGEIGWEDGR